MDEIKRNMQSLPKSELQMYTLGLIEGMVTAANEGNAYRVIEAIRNIYDTYHIVTAKISQQADKTLN
ncbi:hypothetical protein M3661_16860 [Paenibacillus sp. MER 180]|uniref:hypothetical protein n=1 Tax=Paenibacillus sp. MER 180 TaxID=2939570 RepID=UPI00203C24FB|nr:hypothetical protein [Paenibacillus sp. MER 180]MCM3291803.1 hypothetical protein [Paenibacillus sp. MER 180]